MARSKGRTEHFQPSNVVGLDTRIWQEQGSANLIYGAVFTMAGEIVKIDGLRRLVDWDEQLESNKVVRNLRSGDMVASEAAVLAETNLHTVEWEHTDNPFAEINARNKIFTIGTFTWGSTTEVMVAWGDDDTVHIGVLESNNIRLLKTIEISTHDVRPRYYPRFIDVGQFVIILVGGHATLKWDGKLLTNLGVSHPPEPINAIVIRGSKDVFYKTSRLDRGEAGSVRMRYYQTYINKYGQESGLSGPSNEVFINDYFGLFSGDVIVGSTEVAALATDALEGDGFQVDGQPMRDELYDEDEGRYRYAREHLYLVEQFGTESGQKPHVMLNAAGDIYGELPFNERAAMVFLELGDPPEQMDVVERSLYRSINGQTPTMLPRRLGPRARTHFDVRKPSEGSVDPSPSVGSNRPPPRASWAFWFRGRVYYGGVASEPYMLYYSSLHGPEAVGITSFIEVSANDADRLTGWGVAQDYALVFKRNSVFLITHDKAELPVLTPLQATFGAISDRAITSINNKTYFMSDVGIHVFDGSKFDRISKVLDGMVRKLPEFSRDNAVMWSDAKDERVYIAVSNNPGSENNEVWVIQSDTGAFSRIGGREVTHGISYKGESIVALYNNGSGFPDLYLWGGGHQIDKSSHVGVTEGFLSTNQSLYEITPAIPEQSPTEHLSQAGVPAQIGESYSQEGSLYSTPGSGATWPGTYPPQPVAFVCDNAGITQDIGGSIHGEFETEWMEVGDPNTDKRFYRLSLYFVQTGDIDLSVEWCVDWDDRVTVGSTTVSVKADEATTWGMNDDDGNEVVWNSDGTRKWDKRRVVSKTIDLEEAHGKCIRFRFFTGEREDIGPDEATSPWVAMPTVQLSSDPGDPQGGPLVDTGIGVHIDGVEQIVGLGRSTRDKPRYEPWRLVGWHLFLEDHGVRSKGTDGITTADC